MFLRIRKFPHSGADVSTTVVTLIIFCRATVYLGLPRRCQCTQLATTKQCRGQLFAIIKAVIVFIFIQINRKWDKNRQEPTAAGWLGAWPRIKLRQREHGWELKRHGSRVYFKNRQDRLNFHLQLFRGGFFVTAHAHQPGNILSGTGSRMR